VTDTLGAAVELLAPPALVAGRDAELRARVVTGTRPDSVVLFIRPVAAASYQGYPMRPAGSYEYTTRLPGDSLGEGPHDLVITCFSRGSAITFPGGSHGSAADWNYAGRHHWTLDVVVPKTSLRLFAPESDIGLLAVTRIGDAGRRGLFRLGIAGPTGQPAFHLALPRDSAGRGLPDYTVSLVIADRIEARRENIAAAQAVRLRLRGLGPRQVLHLTLMEDDGTSWAATLPVVDSVWSERSIPLSAFAIGRGVLLPQGFPGEWNYWVGPAQGRGGSTDRPRLERVERLQLSLRREADAVIPEGGYGVEVEWVNLEFGSGGSSGR
jgi:hypothetical protein